MGCGQARAARPGRLGSRMFSLLRKGKERKGKVREASQMMMAKKNGGSDREISMIHTQIAATADMNLLLARSC